MILLAKKGFHLPQLMGDISMEMILTHCSISFFRCYCLDRLTRIRSIRKMLKGSISRVMLLISLLSERVAISRRLLSCDSGNISGQYFQKKNSHVNQMPALIHGVAIEQHQAMRLFGTIRIICISRALWKPSV